MRKTKLPPLKTADAFAPAIALGHGIGRLGCFSGGAVRCVIRHGAGILVDNGPPGRTAVSQKRVYGDHGRERPPYESERPRR
jgi:hypothetical protein